MHLRVGADLSRRALGDELSVVQHDDAFAQFHQCAHHVLDDQQGQPVARLTATTMTSTEELRAECDRIVEEGLSQVAAAEQLPPASCASEGIGATKPLKKWKIPPPTS